MLIFLLTSSRELFQRNALLRTYMDDASGMAAKAAGAAERHPGRATWTRSGSPAPPTPKRTVEFDLQVQEKFLRDIPEDSVAGITAANLLGDKFINITKGSAGTAVKPGEELQSLHAAGYSGADGAERQPAARRCRPSSGRVDTMLAGVEQGKGNIGKLLQDEELYTRLNGIAAEGQKLLTDVRSGKGTISKLLYDDTLYQEIRRPIQRHRRHAGGSAEGPGHRRQAAERPGALRRSPRHHSRSSRRVMADLNAGKGTAGKLLKDEQLYKRQMS